MKTKKLLDRESTDFVRDNMLINYCLWDDNELLIESFVENNHIPLYFDLNEYYFCISGVDKKYNLIQDPKTFLQGVTNTYSIYGWINEILRAHHCRGNTFLIKVDNSKQIAVLFSRDPDCSDTAETICALIHQRFLVETPYSSAASRYIVTSLAGPYTGFEGIHSAYLQARRLNDLSFFELSRPVITSAVYDRQIELGLLSIDGNCRKLRNQLCSGNLSDVLEQADYVFDTLVRRSLDISCCMAAHTFVTAMLSLFVTVYGIELDLDFSPADFFTLSEYQEHLKTQLRRLFDGSRSSWYTAEVLLAMGFIHQNYQRDISLKLTADYTNTNVSHLSSEFNRQAGTSLPDYISGLRIQKAKELLGSTSMTISCISREVGFGSERYFTEIFKKREQMTPNQYRTWQRSAVRSHDAKMASKDPAPVTLPDAGQTIPDEKAAEFGSS